MEGGSKTNDFSKSEGSFSIMGIVVKGEAKPFFLSLY
jgi:hypothetical protein